MLRLLLGNCSHSEGPLIEAAKNIGMSVASLGNDPTAKYAVQVDRHFPLDFSLPESVNIAATTFQPDFIVSGANDLSYRAIQRSRFEGLATLDSRDVSPLLIEKAGAKSGVLARFFTFPQTLAVLGEYQAGKKSQFDTPVVVKPVDSAGGKGVSIVNPGVMIDDAWQHALMHSSSKSVLVEQFVDGVELSVSCLISKGAVLGAFFDVELSSAEFNTIDASYTDPEFESAANDALDRVRAMLASFSLADGIFHMQLIVCRQTGIGYLLEVTRRMPGDLYAWEVESSTKMPWSLATLALLCPGSLDLGRLAPQMNLGRFDATNYRPFFRCVFTVGHRLGGLEPNLAAPYGGVRHKWFVCVDEPFCESWDVRKRLAICHCYPETFAQARELAQIFLSGSLFESVTLRSTGAKAPKDN